MHCCCWCCCCRRCSIDGFRITIPASLGFRISQLAVVDRVSRDGDDDRADDVGGDFNAELVRL